MLTVRRILPCLGLLLFSLGQPALAQPSVDRVIVSGVQQFADMAHVDNVLAVSNYEAAKAQFDRNCPLLVAAKLECPDAPKVPKLRLVETATLSRLILEYHQKAFVQSIADLQTGDFDPRPAYVYVSYVPKDGLKYSAIQPLNPIGPELGGGLYAAAVGDVLPDRSEYLGAGNVLYRKFLIKHKNGLIQQFWVAVDGV